MVQFDLHKKIHIFSFVNFNKTSIECGTNLIKKHVTFKKGLQCLLIKSNECQTQSVFHDGTTQQAFRRFANHK